MSRSASSLSRCIGANMAAHMGAMTSSVQTPIKSVRTGAGHISQRWRPGLPTASQHPCHNEIFGDSGDGAGAALALALARNALKTSGKGALAQADDQRRILWVQTADAIKRGGRPYVHGLPPELRRRLIHVEAQSAADALFALEEGARCRDLAFVIGEVRGNPKEWDFTASRRLTLTAQRHGTRLYLLRIDGKPDLSSARMRWNAASAPSLPAFWNKDAPGNPAWKAELFRARSHPPGQWTLYNDGDSLAINHPKISGPTIPIPAAANASNAPSIRPSQTRTPDYGDMARATVGRSLAAL